MTQMEAIAQKNAALVEETTATLTSIDRKVASLMAVVDMAATASAGTPSEEPASIESGTEAPQADAA